MKTTAMNDKSTTPKRTLVKLPEEIGNVTLPSLVAACRGNENIADLLNYLIYEAEKLNVESDEITLHLSHEKMLKRKDGTNRFNFSERSLITYLRQLDTWKMVGTSKYSHSQIVRPGEINDAIANPPEKPRREKTGGRKRCKDESYLTTSTFDPEKVELVKKVEMLQEKVESLQLKVEKFQEFVEKFQLSQSANAALQATPDGKNSSLYVVDSNIPLYTSNTYGETANAVADEHASLSLVKKSTQKKTDRQRRGNKEPVAVQPPLPEADPLTPEQRVWFENVYCRAEHIKVAPKLTDSLLQHIPVLYQHAPTVEKLNSLYKYVRELPNMAGKAVYPGNLVYPNNLNNWYDSQPRQEQPAPTSAPAAPAANDNVIWTRYKHEGAAINHWYLYELMPYAEAQRYGWTDIIPPNDRGNIRRLLKSLAEGRRELTPEQKAELDQLVAVA